MTKPTAKNSTKSKVVGTTIMKCEGAISGDIFIHTTTEEAREEWSKLGFKEISENEIIGGINDKTNS